MKWGWFILKLILIVICVFGGYLIGYSLNHENSMAHYAWIPWAGGACGLLVGFAGLGIEKLIKHIPLKLLAGGTIGLVLGLSIAKLIGMGFASIQNTTINVVIYIILSCIFGYIGMVLGSIKVEEVRFPNLPLLGLGRGIRPNPMSKILDTSVIIDGRIADVVETGFVGGVLVIPEFVLQELQHIADSPDPTRRVRGRRGLDIIKRLQLEKLVEVQIERQDFENINEVDAKLVALALRLGAKIVTNDYNLSKVAEVQGIQVLNINQLANSLKPVVLPGEVLRLHILKEGKEQGQGIAYLEDGTMVVVENASKHLGKEVEVSVTSILQTTAGRLIFTTLKTGELSRQN
ncbi:MAG: TRAM domain-containing protein [Syntrophobacteraceae bacterium]|nr:TRAM domain-containing protein [Syntrophobacteraceae bacterium]